jgi:dipeptidyl-peptidase-4
VTESAPRDPADLAFPEQLARTRAFSCGVPRSFTVAPDGSRVVFLRSIAGDDPRTGLWVLDLATGSERPVFLPEGRGEAATEAERARRERVRERGEGVVAYATDRAVTRAVFVADGRLHLADLEAGTARELPTPGTPDDPRMDPTGVRVAFVIDGSLYVVELDGGAVRRLAAPEDPAVRWGLPEFIAAEEMGRLRGMWWSPDGSVLAACRIDERPVATWWVSDPTDPAAEPRAIRYPQAGTPNAIVSLHLFEVATGQRTEVRWDEPERFEYLARVTWSDGAPLTLLVQSRDQRTTRLLEVDPATGSTALVREDEDRRWVALVPGSPGRLADGRLVATLDREGSRRLVIGEELVTPAGLDVAAIEVVGDAVLVTGSEHGAPDEVHVWRVRPGSAPERVSEGAGVHAATGSGEVVVLTSSLADELGSRTVVRYPGGTCEVPSRAETPIVDPRPRWAQLGVRELRAALLLPQGREPDRRLPVLLAPYGGPQHREVVRHRGAFREAQYLADRLPAAVLVIDGRGTPGRGTDWERAIADNLALALEDQVDGLAAAVDRWPFLDPDRVAMLGWSFGGMLAALAVIDRPDVVHAAVAGAPVTDWRLYDTHYTERYLGRPQEHPDAYERSSPLARAERLTRPLLLIHGLADDNVVAAHSLQLSARLLAAGIPHELLLLPRASHLGGFDAVVVGRHLAVLDFLRRTLGGV